MKLKEFINKVKEAPIIKLYVENKNLKKEVKDLEDTINDMKWGFKNIKTISNGFKKQNPALWLLAFNRINEEADKHL